MSTANTTTIAAQQTVLKYIWIFLKFFILCHSAVLCTTLVYNLVYFMCLHGHVLLWVGTVCSCFVFFQ